MPLDPQIPLGIQPVKINTPFESLDRVLKVQSAERQARADEIEIRAAEQKQRETAAVQQILQESGGDLSDATLKRVLQAAPTVGMKFRSDLIQQRQQALAATKSALDIEETQTKHGLQLLSVAIDAPQLWPTMRQTIAQLIPDLAPGLPEQHDPAVLTNLFKYGEDASATLKAQRAALEGLAEGKFKALASALLVTPDDERPEALEAWRKAGVPLDILKTIAANPQGYATTQAERDTQASRAVDDKRMAAAQAATEAHQAEMERQGRVGLGIRQQSANQGGGAATDSGLVDAILANPAIYGSLTPTVKTRLAAQLAAKGFTGFGNAGKPANGVQKHVFGFFNRAKQADDQLEKLEEDISQMGLGGQLRMQGPNVTQSQLGQSYNQAQRAFKIGRASCRERV